MNGQSFYRITEKLVMKNNQLTTPTAPHERIVLLDVIRGLALFGILLVNAPLLNSPIGMSKSDFAFKTNTWDYIVTSFIYLFATDKFYPIFSLLFGLSAILFMENMAKQGNNPLRLFIRRMVILFFFGAVQVVFIWWGDILVVYAVLGLGLVLFYKISARLLLMIIYTSFLVLTMIHIGLAYYHWKNDYYPDEVMVESTTENTMNESYEEDPTTATEISNFSSEDEMDLIYQKGSFMQIMEQRLRDYYLVSLAGIIKPVNLENFIRYLTYYLHLFAIFLFGAWLQKRKIFQNIDDNWHIITNMGIYATVVAFITHLLSAHFDFFTEAFYPISGLSMGIVYIFIIILLFHKNNWKKPLAPFAAVGKMSLSNYLMSNFILSLLFYGYGFGLYGKMGPGTQLWITLAIYAGLFFWSIFWLKHYRFGPLEWLWRVSTYGQIVAMKSSIPSAFLSSSANQTK